MKKMWDGRFRDRTHELVEQFNKSLTFDIRLYEEDIMSTKAYAKALKKCRILSPKECAMICRALDGLRGDIEQGKVKFKKSDEDIHMAVERMLIERCGDSGAKIHAGRSRNDLVATDTRLYTMKTVRRFCMQVTMLQSTILDKAEKHRETVMAGYTHLQQAQPISLAHYLLSLFFALQRDIERFAGVYETADILPLGAGALAGSGFNLDRKLIASALGFSRVSENGLDAVSDRDFIVEFLSAASILMMHLSRYAADFIIWSSAEFKYLELSDAVSTGSSIMPQKKNPDPLELVRGKTGRIYGNLMGILTVMKGLPLAYAKDMQEDKEALFDSADTLLQVIPVMDAVLSSAWFNEERMKSNLSEMLLATDLADYLANKGIPFRKAHQIVGKITRHCLDNNKSFSAITLKEYKKFSSRFGRDIFGWISFEKSLSRRNIAGGTGKRALARQLSTAAGILKERGFK